MHDLDHKDLVVTPPPALEGFAKGTFSQLLKRLILDVKSAPVHMQALSHQLPFGGQTHELPMLRSGIHAAICWLIPSATVAASSWNLDVQ